LETKLVGKINEDILDLLFGERDVGLLGPGGLVVSEWTIKKIKGRTYGSLPRWPSRLSVKVGVEDREGMKFC
jgi:hypothetical protein